MAKSPPKATTTTALDAEAGIPLVENNATNTGNANAAAVSTGTSAIRGVRFNGSTSTGTGAYRRQGRHDGRLRESWFSRQRSTLRRQYNVDPNEGGVGEMIGDMANAMADNEYLAERNAELSLRLSKMGIKLLVLVCLLALMAVATGLTSYFAITKSETNLQHSITDNAVTGVEVDSTGMAHLTDKQGRDMSTRATGDLYTAELIRTPSGRKLHCVTVEDAANMAHSIASGADANVALMDESGVLEQEILSLSGNFEDAGDALDFASGNIHVLLDDDSCNVDEAGESDNENKNNTDLFTRRGLEKGSTSTQKRSDILTRNREIYFKHRAALKTGQRVLRKNKKNKVPITSDKKKNDAILTPKDISDFAEILFTETQQFALPSNLQHSFASQSNLMMIPDDESSLLGLETTILIRSMELFEESHGKMETEAKNQLMTVLADDSNDQFDDCKILMIEKQGGKNVCELGSANLCKGEKKSNMEQDVHEAVLQGIQEASEDLDNEPDFEVILLGVQEKLGVNASTIEWFIQENQATMQDISEKFEVAKEKYIEEVLTKRSEKVEQVLGVALDAGSSLESAVSNSEFSDDEIEEAFRFFAQEKKDEMRGKSGKAKNEQQQKIGEAYENLGFKKNSDSDKGKSNWEAPSAEEEPFVIGEDGKMYYSKSKGKKQAQEQINEAKQKVNDEHQGRRLKVQEHKKNISSFKANMPSRIAVIQHRLMLEMEDLAVDACPRINIGCFGDSQDDRDLQLNLGSGYSISSCLDQCHDEGYPYAGLQAGSTCFCGDDTYGKYGESDTCSIACVNGVGVCGGPSANSIYKYIGLPNAECVSKEFQALSSALANVTSHIVDMVHPITQTLDSMDWAGDKIMMASTLLGGIGVAVLLGSKIPYIGPIIQAVQKFIDPVADAIQAANSRIQNYQNNVGTIWENSFRRILDLFESFDTSFALSIAGTAAGVSALGNNQCAKSIFTNIAGDLITPMETAFGTVMSYVESLLDSLQSLLDVLASTAWQTIQDGLNAILEKVPPVLEWLNPLEGLGALLDAEVTLPWFQLPYFEKFLGDAYCDQEYYLGSWYSKCWEKESSEWEEISIVSPFKMQRKCSFRGYEEHWLYKTCWNNNYFSPRKGQTWGWINGGWIWGPWCPDWNYHIYSFSPLYCTKECPWDKFMSSGYCYSNTCHSGYSKSSDGRLCEGHARNQLSHEARCDSYSYEEGSSRYLDGGECWQGCNENHGSFFGACFPPAELTLSINMVADAFKDIIDFITGLPIVSMIEEAINTIIGAVLKPVMDYINSMSPFNFPEFPSFDIDLPLDVSFDLPQLPDISQLTNLPETIFSSLPFPSLITDCGLDMNCIAEATGMVDIFTSLEPLVEVFEVLNIETLTSNFIDALTGATCTEWEDITLPVNDLFSKVPALAGTSGCDVVIPMCKNLDFSNSGAALAAIREDFESLFGIGRRLGTEWADFLSKVISDLVAGIMSVKLRLSFLVQWGASPNVIRRLNGLDWGGQFGQKMPANPQFQAMYLSNTFDAYLLAAPSFDYAKGQLNVDLTISGGFNVFWNRGLKSLLKEALEKIEANKKESMAYNLIDETCADLIAGRATAFERDIAKRKICGLKFLVISIANQEWYRPKTSWPDWLENHNDVKWLFRFPDIPDKCTEENLKDMVEELQFASLDGNDFEDAYFCIQYWFGIHHEVDILMNKISWLETMGYEDDYILKRALASGDNVGAGAGNYVYNKFVATFSTAALVKLALAKLQNNDWLAPPPPPSPDNPNGDGFHIQIGYLLCHPTHQLTCLGPTLLFNLSSLVEFHFGVFEISHLLNNLGDFFSDETETQTLAQTRFLGFLEDWPHKFNFEAQYKKKLNMFPLPTSPPTKIPTQFPTSLPTKAPTPFPTSSPTKAPTQSPTSSPSKRLATRALVVNAKDALSDLEEDKLGEIGGGIRERT